MLDNIHLFFVMTSWSHVHTNYKISTALGAKCTPITLDHLTALRHGLDLNNTFDATVFGMATITFWCQCHIAKVCVDSSFDPPIHASCSSPQNSGTMISNICYSSFWAPSTKMNPSGEEI